MPSADEAQTLHTGAAALGCTLDANQGQRLLAYRDLLVQWNRVHNLTAVRDPGQMLTQHLLDSLSLLAPLQRHRAGRATRLLDVGSGGGLPGVVLALLWPALDVVCVDAVAKKAGFIRQVAATLHVPNLRAVHSRVESLQDVGAFDVVVSRAFSSLSDFVRLTHRHLAPGGVWVAMKGRPPEAEIADLPPDVRVFHVEPLKVPGLTGERCLIWMAPCHRDSPKEES